MNTNTTVTIRAVQSEDGHEIALGNWKKMWKDVGMDSSHFVADCHSKTCYFISHAKQELGFKLFVAETPDGIIVGSLCCQVWAGPHPCALAQSKIGTVWAVYVEPEYRRQGIATKLMTRCIKHWKQLGCTEAVLIYASEEGKRIYQRLGFRPGRMLANDLSQNKTSDQMSTISPAEVQDESTSFSIHRVQDDSHDLLLATNYRKLLQQTNGSQPESFLCAHVVKDTLQFIQDARLRLNFSAFVTRNDKGEVVASVCSQIWEGPLPCIVDEKALKFASMWGLYVDPNVKTDTTMLVADLVGACVAFMKSIGCHKILTLCPSTMMCKLLSSVCSFHSSNALVLDMPQEDPTWNATEQVQNSHQVLGVTQNMVDKLRQSHESLKSLPFLELSWILIANHNQLEALGMSNDVKSCIERVQKYFSLYQDPSDNWFTRNVAKLGKGFDLEKLSKNPQALAAEFDKLAPNYDAWTLGNQSKIETWIVQMARQHKLSKDVHVLDLCCGTGLQGLTLRLCGFQGILTGLDVSPKMIEAAKHRCCYDHLLVANVNQGIQQPRAIADVILCTGAMELLDVGKVLATFSRLLKHGGMLWVTFQAKQDNLTSTVHQNVQGLELETMKRELALYGFEIESTDNHPDAFYTPSPDLDGTLLPVPYFFVCGRKKAT